MDGKNRLLMQDAEEIAGNMELAERFRNSTVFITGATGLLGMQAVFALICMNRMQHCGIHIVAMVRSRENAEKALGKWMGGKDLTLYYGDVSQPIAYEEQVDYILHGASATSSGYFVSHPVETIQTALKGTENVLEFAKQNAVKGMVFLSSLEVYGTPDATLPLIDEKAYGYLDPTSVRSSYSEGKRMAECMCASYASEYGVPVKMARLSQTFGPGVAYEDGRVFAEFARCVAEKKDIVLHTQGNTVRSYCYTKDAVAAIFYILFKGQAGEAYNVTNMDTAVSIREMAELVCGLYPERGIRVRIEIPKDVSSFGYNPEMIIRPDSTKLSRLGWTASVALPDMFRRMIEDSFLF